jgi:hypothetical protein
VANSHEFVANGIIVHNCDTLSQALAFFRDQEWLNIDPEPVKDPFEDEDSWQDEVKYSNPYAV